ncbi:xanthine dehydrogenase family protein subunit M [Streptomyces sp. WMMB 322]|uniref:FAD binding domain-containing protein n=1 Tax=Streptomyces sp. WMMB 322 TaxID=1286821 RepID=UPI0006E2A160|nr:FAD binding domain-containing protein [Streptomyces sp. WMMB 322]SCK06160.1 xanthine dehydrogenase YagS FAD-binding subunit [Streptomyces sp. WMMB 322]
MKPPSDLDDIVRTIGECGGELRAGGTDVMARRRVRRTAGPFVDLLGVPALRGVTWRPDGSARVGAMTTVMETADDPRLRAAYPALTATAGALATPQIRTAGTLGGNLLQRNRCAYYRNPHFTCFQTGGDTCPSRDGLHLYSAVVEQGPCIAPHPSSIAMALLAYDAHADVHNRGRMPVRDLYGDGTDPTRDHLLPPTDVLLAVDLPAPVPGERAAYHRAISRAEAEWPLVEAVARVVLDGTTVTSAAVAVGGVAHTPLRLPEVEAALTGAAATPENLLAAAATATSRCTPLPQTGYKVGLLRDTVLHVLEKATAVPDGEAERPRAGRTEGLQEGGTA